MAVVFLSTRVKKPDQDDIKKLSRTMQYRRFTQHMRLTFEADELIEVKWWFNASFSIHCDMRSHTGGVMSLGEGAICALSKIQRINTKLRSKACGNQ